MDEYNQLVLKLNHMFIHMCNHSDEVTKCGSDSLTVNERLMSRGTPVSITLAVVQWY